MIFKLFMGTLAGLFMYVITFWNPVAALITFVLVASIIKEKKYD